MGRGKKGEKGGAGEGGGRAPPPFRSPRAPLLPCPRGAVTLRRCRSHDVSLSLLGPLTFSGSPFPRTPRVPCRTPADTDRPAAGANTLPQTYPPQRHAMGRRRVPTRRPGFPGSPSSPLPPGSPCKERRVRSAGAQDGREDRVALGSLGACHSA